MRPFRVLVRSLFCFAAALTAAATADPLVEGLSNAGVFGPGRFTDGSNADVIPALGIGGLCAALFCAALAGRILVTGASSRWMQASAELLAARAVLRLLPVIVALQVAMLFSMETLEQIAVFGHALGGTVWVGGPLVVSLAIHAVAGALVSSLFVVTLHHLARRIAAVIAFVRHLVLTWSGLAPRALARTQRVLVRHPLEPALARLHGRAPPYRTLS